MLYRREPGSSDERTAALRLGRTRRCQRIRITLTVELIGLNMRRNGFLIAQLASAFIALSSACVDPLLHAADDSVPPKPVSAPPGETAKPATKPSPQSPDQLPAPVTDLRQQTPNDQIAQIPAPLTNTLPNLAANSNASSIPNFIGDLMSDVPLSSAIAQRQKLAENASPLPRDRVFVNYNYFHGLPTIVGDKGVSRITPGFEKTFFNQLASVEMRLPFTAGLPNNADVLTDAYSSGTELGNFTMYLKGLLYSSPEMAISSGLGIQLPTASDSVTTQNGAVFSKLENRSVHLMPFLAATYAPGSRYYAQGALQFDFDANGNPLFVAQNKFVVQEQTALYASLATGYWIYRVTNPYERGLTGIAPTAELHYNTTLQPSDIGNQQPPVGQIASFNGIVGVNAVFGNNKYITIGYCTPLGSSDAQFNGELRVMFNYYFGGSTVNPRFNLVPSR